MAVQNYLIEKGISPNRISAKGHGEKRPTAYNKIKKAQNRHVDLALHN